MEFTDAKTELNFFTLDQCLTGEIDAPKAKLIQEFVDFYGEGANYQLHKARFENTATFNKMVELLKTTKPPMLAELLRLIMVYSRPG